jgi:hypothetical protein
VVNPTPSPKNVRETTIRAGDGESASAMGPIVLMIAKVSSQSQSKERRAWRAIVGGGKGGRGEKEEQYGKMRGKMRTTPCDEDTMPTFLPNLSQKVPPRREPTIAPTIMDAENVAWYNVDKPYSLAMSVSVTAMIPV